MKLRFRRTAQSDVARIFDYLSEQSPQARLNVEASIRTTLERLLEFPLIGSATTRPGVRRLIVTSYPYAIFYRISGDTIIVLSLRHTARKPRFP